MSDLTTLVARWRARLTGIPALTADDVDELQSHLEDEIDTLRLAGLTEDEAFLIATRRLGADSRLAGQFEEVHSERTWARLDLPTATDPRSSLWIMIGTAASTAAVMLVLYAIARSDPSGVSFLLRNLGTVAFAGVLTYFALVHRPPRRVLGGAAGLGAALVIVTNLYPPGWGAENSWTDTVALIALHLPVALWGAFGIVFLRTDGGRPGIDVVRFTGEWIIYAVLLVLAGGAFTGLASVLLIPVTGFYDLPGWIITAGFGALVVVAAWLVDSKRRTLENLAPVLATVFTPLLAALALAATIVYVVNGLAVTFDRDLLVTFDLLLLAVFAIVIFGLSVRGDSARATVTDHLRTVAVLAAVVLDALVLASMIARVGELGLTANRVAALGLNVILVVSLAVTAWLSARLALGRTTPHVIQGWQVRTLPVLATWAAVVAVVVPPVFGFP